MRDIRLIGARQNNLKSIDVRIPIGSLTTICGPSGSGKSSLAFETLYAEGQRRYIESLSNYSKQFLNKAPKPDVEFIENILPAISIEQKNTVKSSRSTVGTMTEVVDYLRLLYEKIGIPYCPHHQLPLEKDSPSSAAQKIVKFFKGKRGYILVPILTTSQVRLDQLLQDGFIRILRTGKKKTPHKSQPYFQEKLGEVVELETLKSLPSKDFYVVVDRLRFEDVLRLVDSISQAFVAMRKYNKDYLYGQAKVLTTDGWGMRLDENYSCSICEYSFPSIDSRFFSFNSPLGACEKCKGFGSLLTLDPQKVIPNPKLSLKEGAIKPWFTPSTHRAKSALMAYCKSYQIPTNIPWEKLPVKTRNSLWEGHKRFPGVVGFFKNLEKKKYKMHVRILLARYKSSFTCQACNGTRLKPKSQQVLVGRQPINGLVGMSVEELSEFITSLKWTRGQKNLCREILRQLTCRLSFLKQVGLGYMTLDRLTSTLSGGEYQRIMLANQLGIELSQTLYVLDEPTVGLHPRDNDRLIHILHSLKDLGNTLVVVEHDRDVIQSSSHVIEMGPGSGHLGGNIVFHGKKEAFLRSSKSNTASYLINKGSSCVVSRPTQIKNYHYTLQLKGCTGNNLKDVDVQIPLYRFVTVTGVSGSGKSSLINQTLYPVLARLLDVNYLKGLPYRSIKGVKHLNHVLLIDSSSVGTSSRSLPITYLKAFDAIRALMASSKEARKRGYMPGTFSINVEGGRCPVCKGLGVEVVDMMFMDDIHIPCESCGGSKYREETLEITYKGKNISEILNMTVSEAMDFFVSHPNICKPLTILKEVGLDYLVLGQPTTSLSGGESQRLKIAKEFNSSQQRGTLYILDEPTTGLHFKEVHLLLKVLNRLIDGGGSVLVIEHNLDVICHSDYVIDIGPEAGDKGGKVIAQGSPEVIMKDKNSHTGRYLRRYVGKST